MFGELGDLLRRNYDSSRQVADMRVPTLIVFADADAIEPERIVEF